MKVHYIETVPAGNTEITDPFMSRYTGIVESKILPYQWKMINDDEKSGIIHDFRVAAGDIEGDHIGMVFQDEGLPKWLEAAAYSLAHHRDPEIEAWVDYAADLMERAQREDGYLLTYFQLKHPDKGFRNLLESHELVCMGNILEAGIAYERVTGKDKILKVAMKLADHLYDFFMKDGEDGKLVPGHPGVEFCLVKLYRKTGEQKYLDLAKHFIDNRGTDPEVLEKQHDREWNLPNIFDQWYSWADHKYMQIHAPVREQTTAEGHGVRACYLYAGMADVYMETGDESLLRACETIHKNIRTRRMYITGGIGSADCGERFTADYDLPNDTNYAESCASVALALFSRRMFQATGDGKYLDTAERAIYNTVNASVSLDGESYFYVNPLEVWPEATKLNPTKRHVKPIRQGWYQVACCPQNTLRTLAAFDEYLYYVRDNTLYIGLFAAGTSKIPMGDRTIELKVDTRYPFENQVNITLETDGTYELAIRKPGFSKTVTITLNGQKINAAEKNGMLYLDASNVWKKGDVLSVVLDMPAVLVSSHPRVRANAQKLAFSKGPLVYCLEEIDNGDNLNSILVSPDAEIREVYDPELLGGTLTLQCTAKKISEAPWDDEDLYKEVTQEEETIELKAIPYCLWNNRGEGEMTVWINRG